MLEARYVFLHLLSESLKVAISDRLINTYYRFLSNTNTTFLHFLLRISLKKKRSKYKIIS